MAAEEDPIVSELRKLSRLFAVALMQGNQREKIRQLSEASFSPKDIADILGIKPNVVSAELSNLKKTRSPKGRKRSK